MLVWIILWLIHSISAQTPTIGAEPVPTPTGFVGWNRFERKVLGHAILGGITFTLISPSAVLIARWFRNRSWFPFHGSLQTLTFCTTLTGFILINVAVYEKVHYYEIWNYGPHHRMGIFLFGFVMIQFFLGGISYSLLKPIHTRYRRIINWCHMVLGITITTLGYIQVYLGFHHWETLSNPRERRHVPTAVRAIYWILVVTEILVYGLGVWRDRKNYFQVPLAESSEQLHEMSKDPEYEAKSPTTPAPWYDRKIDEHA